MSGQEKFDPQEIRAAIKNIEDELNKKLELSAESVKILHNILTTATWLVTGWGFFKRRAVEAGTLIGVAVAMKAMGWWPW